MKVSVDLSKYFNDHRSLAYIFVNKKTMSYIQDVEAQISKIFSIDNFYLKQQDHYLPSTEDVSILVDDCDLCVIPMNESNCTVSEDCSMKSKKNKKKKVKGEIGKAMEQEDLENEAPKTNKKRKVIEENAEDNNDDQSKAQTKKSKTDKQQTINTNRRETFKEHLEKILIKNDEITNRPPNIVKTIIVSGNNFAKTDDCKAPVSNDSSSDSNSSTGTGIEANADEIEWPKRRRRRTRTRKRRQRRNNINGETIQQCSNDTESITPKLPIAKPSGLHIRFLDNWQNNEKKPEVKLETVKPEISIKQEVTDTSNDNVIKNTVENTIGINKISDSFILKQPLIGDILPKINDLIAFKILRLNDAYTPELSQFIIGKVTAFNFDTDKEITLDIKQGLDYCLQPQGKFSIDTEEAADQKTIFTFKWSELIEPRLIFP